jgi:hypothetical protein
MALAIAAIGATAVPSTQEGSARPLALVGGTLIDGGPGEPVRNSVVLIRGGLVEQVRTVESLTVPAGYDRISTEGIVIKDGRRYR